MDKEYIVLVQRNGDHMIETVYSASPQAAKKFIAEKWDGVTAEDVYVPPEVGQVVIKGYESARNVLNSRLTAAERHITALEAHIQHLTRKLEAAGETVVAPTTPPTAGHTHSG